MARDHEAGAYKARPGGMSARASFRPRRNGDPPLVGGGRRWLCPHRVVSRRAPLSRAPGRSRGEGGKADEAWLLERGLRSRSSRPSRPGASSPSAGQASRGTPGTAPIGRSSTSPSTRRSRCSPGERRKPPSCSGSSRSARRSSAASRSPRTAPEAFNGNRLAEPIGYENASAALFLMAFWPALALAARPEVHWAARGLLLAAGGALLQLALLAQSRGSILGVAVALPLLVLLSRERARVLAALLLVAVATLATLDPLLDVVAGGGEAEVERAVARERRGARALERRAAPDRLGSSRSATGPGAPGRALLVASRRRAVALLAAALALAAVGAGVAASTLEDAPRPGLQSGRYDMWRVAAGEFAERPLLGVGADNFAVDFVRERRTGEEPLYPHSLLLRTVLADRSRRRRALPRLRRDRSRSCAATAPGTRRLDGRRRSRLRHRGRLLARARLDRLALGDSRSRSVRSCASRAGIRPRAEQGSRSHPGAEHAVAAALAAAGALFLAAAASYAFPGLAALELERAVRAWPDSEQTFSRLERAHRLNPLSERADVVAGTLGEGERATRPGPEGIRASARAQSRRLVRASPACASRSSRGTRGGSAGATASGCAR